MVVALVLVLIEADVVEDKELRLGSEIGDVRNSRALQVLLGLAGDVPRIPGIVLPGHRVADVADHDQGLGLERRDR